MALSEATAATDAAAKAVLNVDFAALRKLRDDDASGAIKEIFGDGDPREWTY